MARVCGHGCSGGGDGGRQCGGRVCGTEAVARGRGQEGRGGAAQAPQDHLQRTSVKGWRLLLRQL